MAVLGAVAVPHPPVILPEIGKGEERAIKETQDAYRSAARFIRELGAKTVVILSPHSTMYADYFHISQGREASGDFSRFGAPMVRISCKYDMDFVRDLSLEAMEQRFPAGTLGDKNEPLDHGTLIPLYFLRQEGLADIEVVRAGLSGLTPEYHYRLGQMIQSVAEKLDRPTVVLASGDLSHKLSPDGPYGYAGEGPILDAAVQKIFESADFLSLLSLSSELREAAAECGIGAFEIMAGALDKRSVQAELLSYEGPFGVGYAVATFKVVGEDNERALLREYQTRMRQNADERRKSEDAYVNLARTAVEEMVRGHKRVAPDYARLPAPMAEERAGVFVSLKKYGRLRGCIGTIEPTQNDIAQEIIVNGISAATQDPRFEEVRPDELDAIVYSVDVLKKPERTTFADLDPKKYGVIVSARGRRGVLLPDLPGVETAAEQIEIALAKAGIHPRAKYDLERFEVERHH